MKKNINLLKKMILIRMLEERIAEEYKNNEIRCPVHLSIGQEACAVGACYDLHKDDIVFSTHRSHAHYIAKNCNINSMIAELYGKETGCCGGRGGSMHLIDTSQGMYGSIPIVGSSIGLASGAAYHQKLNKLKNITVVFLGDASLEEGIFHEAANFAALHKLPLIFICENNLYSVYTNIKDRQPHQKFTRYAESHGIKSKKIDGNDVEKINLTVNEMKRKCLKNQGPFFIQLDTYRWREHCGPNYDNKIGYRSVKEFNKWKKKCPIIRYEKKLINENILTSQIKKSLINENQKIVNKAFNYAFISNFPNHKSAHLKVYAK